MSLEDDLRRSLKFEFDGVAHWPAGEDWQAGVETGDVELILLGTVLRIALAKVDAELGRRGLGRRGLG